MAEPTKLMSAEEFHSLAPMRPRHTVSIQEDPRTGASIEVPVPEEVIAFWDAYDAINGAQPSGGAGGAE